MNPVAGFGRCRQHQIEAFTRFKNEFDTRGCNHSDYYNGVRCDHLTGEVMKLRLSACLGGTLKSNSSLFQFHYLRYLDLSRSQFKFRFTYPTDHGNDVLEALWHQRVPNHNTQFIDLSNNKINGKIPEWLWKLPNLTSVNIVNNYYFNGFEGSKEVLVHSSVRILLLASNNFEGALPDLPLSINVFSAGNNSFTGDIPLSICNRSSLAVLDLNYNNFTGPIPHCLSNLTFLNLRKNNFEGSIPNVFFVGATLRTFDVGYNRLTGKLLRSFINCSSLEFLSIDNNKIKDTFPFWLKAYQVNKSLHSVQTIFMVLYLLLIKVLLDF